MTALSKTLSIYPTTYSPTTTTTRSTAIAPTTSTVYNPLMKVSPQIPALYPASPTTSAPSATIYSPTPTQSAAEIIRAGLEASGFPEGINPTGPFATAAQTAGYIPPPNIGTQATQITPGVGPQIVNTQTGQVLSTPSAPTPGRTQIPTPPRPTMTAAPSSAAELYQRYRSLLGPTPNTAGAFASQGPHSISGLGQDYFNQQRDLVKEQLRRDFFGPLGGFQQAASAESAAGRLGSGVGQQILSEAAIAPFMRQLSDTDVQYQGMFDQERARVEQFNAEQQNLYLDRLAQLTSNDANAGVQLNQLASQAAQAQAGLLSQQAIAQLEADLRVWEAAVADAQKQRELDIQAQQNAITYVTSPIKDPTAGQTTVAGQLNNLYG